MHVCVGVEYGSRGKLANLGGYERASAAFLFFDLCLSMLACLFAVRAVEELREKKRDDLHHVQMGSLP